MKRAIGSIPDVSTGILQQVGVRHVPLQPVFEFGEKHQTVVRCIIAQQSLARGYDSLSVEACDADVVTLWQQFGIVAFPALDFRQVVGERKSEDALLLVGHPYDGQSVLDVECLG